MAGTPEKKVKQQIKNILATTRAYWVMPVSNGMGVHGVPDFLVCHKGQFFGIEAKAGRGTTTALQEKHLADIRAAGGKTLVVNESNMDELKEMIDE
jgi:hypothetical protein